MKRFNHYLACFAVFALIFTSCSKDEETANVQDETALLSLGPVLNNMADRTTNKQATPVCSDDTPAWASFTISYGSVEKDLVVEILSDAEGLFTAYDEALEIPITTGNTVTVTLHDFKVWNDNGSGAPGTIIWAAPMEGSEYAKFVTRPTGDDFDIVLRAGSKNYTDVEVLCFDDREVNRYGYQFFDILPKELYELCFFANYCPDGPTGRDRVANYNLDLYYYYGNAEEMDLIYSDKSPTTGGSGNDTYADPLCIAVPGPMFGEGTDDLYLYYELTLADWPGYYGEAPELTQSGYLSWEDVEALFGDDNTVDYIHLFFNCGTPPNEDCPPGQDIDGDGICDDIDDCIDTDHDGVCNPDDICPGYDDNVDTDQDGIPDGCDFNDCIGDDCPECEVLEDCETAFMQGNESFLDSPYLDFKNRRWGWAHMEDDGVEPNITPLWAAAGQNDTSKGYFIGTVTVTNEDGENVNVTIDLCEGNTLDEVHIFYANEAPENNAPGQYQYSFTPSEDGYSFDLPDDDDGDFWLIVHADACPSED